MKKTMKRRIISLMLAFCMVMSMMPATVFAVETDNSSIVVKIGEVVLEDATYYVPDTTNVVAVKEDITDVINYFYYNQGVMTMFGEVKLSSAKTILSISNGELTITGTGNFVLRGTGLDPIVIGKNASICTQEYSGNIDMQSLNTTISMEGDISL